MSIMQRDLEQTINAMTNYVMTKLQLSISLHALWYMRLPQDLAMPLCLEPPFAQYPMSAMHNTAPFHCASPSGSWSPFLPLSLWSPCECYLCWNIGIHSHNMSKLSPSSFPYGTIYTFLVGIL